MSKESYYNPVKKEKNNIDSLFTQTVDDKFREKIVCRFRNKEDLDIFLNNNNLTDFNITKYTKYIDFRTNEKQDRKEVKKRVVEGLFETQSSKHEWEDYWNDMPRVVYDTEREYAKIELFFCDKAQAEKILDQKISKDTNSVWCPKLVYGRYSKKRALGGEQKGKYPIYILSKGRAKYCTTSKFLSQMEIKHYVVVEPSDVKDYKEFVENDYAEIIEADMKYEEDYDTFDDLGNTKSKGSGPKRNFIWDHSIKSGSKFHWIMDDNAAGGFNFLDNNRRIKCKTGAILKAAEDFVDRFSNVAIGGLNYSKFCPDTSNYPPYVLNTRIYSFLLIRNDIPYRWRGRYNEDTDLSLRVLKGGWCTILFNSFLADKATTQTVKGGNTDDLYGKEGTYPKSKMLQEMHPDVTKVVWKFHRWHHEVNYKGFKQRLEYKKDYKVKKGINNYGIVIIDTKEDNMDNSRSYLEKKYKKEIEEKRNEN